MLLDQLVLLTLEVATLFPEPLQLFLLVVQRGMQVVPLLLQELDLKKGLANLLLRLSRIFPEEGFFPAEPSDLLLFLLLLAGVQLDKGLLGFLPLPVRLTDLLVGQDGKGLQHPDLLFKLPLFVHDKGCKSNKLKQTRTRARERTQGKT